VLAGVMVPLVTPLAEDGSVSGDDVAALVAAVRPHVQGLVPALSTGEGWLLDERQWHDMVAHTVAHAGDLPVLAGVLRPTTAEVIDRAERAAALGARAVAVATPFGTHVTQQQMYRHYADVAAASPVPVVVYHESVVSGNRLSAETLMRVLRLPGVVAVKDSTGDLKLTRWLLRAGMAVFQGRDDLLDAVNGVAGYLVALANLEPELCARMWRGRDRDTAELVEKKCAEHDLFDDDWYRAIKRRLHYDGVITNPRLVIPVR
jgi:4-hydroxy-tetrahydrodipicolinate synthase